MDIDIMKFIDDESSEILNVEGDEEF